MFRLTPVVGLAAAARIKVVRAEKVENRIMRMLIFLLRKCLPLYLSFAPPGISIPIHRGHALVS